ncbi:uncharacterized protein LOC119100179 [Pollicipes pollicipes]|uniref:uncharacterized protein LOC119100179 n=1 Tax=Pollicipes pollicipes TaxID=41117 RepID=UPI001884E240|nr:uncharacterized protein LOC119100179 [Pollicipes pollicipes]
MCCKTGRAVTLLPEDLHSDDGGSTSDAADCAAGWDEGGPVWTGQYCRAGQLARLVSGQRLQLEPEVRRVTNIGRLRLTQLVCGMLNTGEGGSVYYGVTREGRISGLQVDRRSRDCLRLGLDKTLSDRLVPPPPPDCCRLEFVPVLGRRQPLTEYRPAEHSLFVVAVHCRPAPREVFVVRDTGAAYLRGPGPDGRAANLELTIPQLRHLVAEREMALASRRETALRSAADCLRRMASRAAPSCDVCGGLLPAPKQAEQPRPAADPVRRWPCDSDSSGLEMG